MNNDKKPKIEELTGEVSQRMKRFGHIVVEIEIVPGKELSLEAIAIIKKAVDDAIIQDVEADESEGDIE